jgi:hypothetical protein
MRRWALRWEDSSGQVDVMPSGAYSAAYSGLTGFLQGELRAGSKVLRLHPDDVRVERSDGLTISVTIVELPEREPIR